mgnify:CR=1 FL=1
MISQCLCYDIINLLIKTVNQINGLESQSLDLKELCTFHDVEEFYEKSKKATISICEQYGSYRTLKNKEQKSEMLRYVNDHYSQQTISLDVLAGSIQSLCELCKPLFQAGNRMLIHPVYYHAAYG